MSIVLLEGIDGTGKSTIIKQLQEKYPKLKSMAFPVNREVLKVEYDRDSFQEVCMYHKQFVKDFIDNQLKIADMVEDGSTLLLDRYYLSHVVYVMYDYANHATKTGIKFDAMLKELIGIQNMSLTQLSRLIAPSDVIFLFQKNPKNKRLQGLYEMVMLAFKERPAHQIEGLTQDTFSNVENMLLENDYI